MPTRKPVYRLPDYLASFQAALRYAKSHHWWAGNTDNEEEAGLSEEQVLRNRVRAYQAEAAKIAKAGKATVYRTIRIPLVEDPRTVIDFDCLGTSWTWDFGLDLEEGSSEWSIEDDLGVETEAVTLEGRADPDDVEWALGLNLFILYGLDESEIPLRENATVRVRAISHEATKESGWKRRVRRVNILGNTGTADRGAWSLSPCAQRWGETLKARLAAMPTRKATGRGRH
jgi:hypothetical protein